MDVLRHSHVWLFTTPYTVVSDSLQPMDCSLPGSSVHGSLQARILEWVAISFSRFSRPSNQTQVSCIAGRLSLFLPTKPPGKPYIQDSTILLIVENTFRWLSLRPRPCLIGPFYYKKFCLHPHNLLYSTQQKATVLVPDCHKPQAMKPLAGVGWAPAMEGSGISVASMQRHLNVFIYIFRSPWALHLD